MIRSKWVVGFRNRLSTLYGECNSCAAIEESRLTSTEREDLRAILSRAIKYVDERILK